MALEDRDYYRGESFDTPDGGVPGFRFRNQAIVTSLIVINAVIFIADTFTPELSYPEWAGVEADTPISMPDGSIAVASEIPPDGHHWLSHFLGLKADQPWLVWNFLTTGFAHTSLAAKGGVLHIGFNMFMLFMFGKPVEEKLGRAEFLKFYLLAILAGSFAWFIPQWLMGSGNVIVGASGAVSAVLIYFVFYQPHARLTLLFFGEVPAWVVGVLFLGSNLFHALAHDGVAWEAHLGGAAFGYLYHRFQWSFESFKMPISAGGTKLKVHQPDQIDDKLQLEADRILDKINREGQDSLTRRERKTLEKYSKQIRRSRQ